MKKPNLRLYTLIGFFSLLALNSVYSQVPVVHLVLFKLKPEVDKEGEAYKSAYLLLKNLPQKIKGIQEWSFGENFSTRPIAFDVGLYSVFDSKKALNDYLTHPAHVEAVSAWKEIATWHIVDYVESAE